jgi:hypothetical protein
VLGLLVFQEGGVKGLKSNRLKFSIKINHIML